MICKQRRHPCGGHRSRSIATTVAAAALAVFSCNFIGDIMTPFEYSTVTFRGTVLDSATKVPLSNAGVMLLDSDERAATDGNGEFLFSATRTGLRTVLIAKDGYLTDTSVADLRLDVRPLTFLLAVKNVPPVIVAFSALPDTIRSIEDTVRFCFKARDSTDGIVKAIVETGEAGSTIEKAWPGAPESIEDTFRFRYQAPGTFTARLTVIGKNADTARDSSVRVVVPNNRRPVFTLVRPSQGGFVNGEWGFVEVYVRDHDADFHYLTVDWGDTSKSEKSFDTAKVYWHKYNFQKDTSCTIKIRLFDSAGATRDTAILVEPKTVSPPKLDDRIVYAPNQYLTPDDTAVVIGVKVLSIDGGYVSAILWLINQDDPAAAQSFRKDYTPETGKISVTENVFAHLFATGKLKATNIVQIIVVDKNGRTSSVTGSFYKAGLPGP